MAAVTTINTLSDICDNCQHYQWQISQVLQLSVQCQLSTLSVAAETAFNTIRATVTAVAAVTTVNTFSGSCANCQDCQWPPVWVGDAQVVAQWPEDEVLEEEAQEDESCSQGEGDEEVVELGVVRPRIEVGPGDVWGKPDSRRPEHRAQAASHRALSETPEK